MEELKEVESSEAAVGTKRLLHVCHQKNGKPENYVVCV